MASTNKTPNLNLNQWEPDDPVLREDFNADNAKIDQAVFGQSLVRLARFATSQSASALSVDLSDVSLEGCQALWVLFQLPGDADQQYGSTRSRYILTLNNREAENAYHIGWPDSSWTMRTSIPLGIMGVSGVTLGEVLLYLNDGALRGRAQSIPEKEEEPSSVLFTANTVTRSNLASLNVRVANAYLSDLVVPAGAVAQVYGLKTIPSA